MDIEEDVVALEGNGCKFVLVRAKITPPQLATHKDDLTPAMRTAWRSRPLSPPVCGWHMLRTALGRAYCTCDLGAPLAAFDGHREALGDVLLPLPLHRLAAGRGKLRLDLPGVVPVSTA